MGNGSENVTIIIIIFLRFFKFAAIVSAHFK